MTRHLRVRVEIENVHPARITAVQRAASRCWPFERWAIRDRHILEPVRLFATECNYAASWETTEAIVEKLTARIWHANDAYCAVCITVTDIDAAPSDEYVRGEDDYELFLVR